MTGSLYNPIEIPRNTLAKAEQINSEFNKIRTAFDALNIQIAAIVAGTPLASYTWIAFADSADGTSNFSTSPGTRKYWGVAFNRATETPGTDPTVYTWKKIVGDDGVAGTDGTNGNNGVDGNDGTDGDYRDILFRRQYDPPTTPVAFTPSGWSQTVPAGVETLWFTIAQKSAAGALLSGWSEPARLTISNRGIYINTETYYQQDIVTKNGGSYILTVSESTGNAPTGTAQSNAYWDVFAAPGDEGAPATPPSAFSSTINLTSSSSGSNLRTLADAAGYTGMSDATITFNVPSGVTVQGLANGGIGIDSGSWPTSSYTITIALVVQGGGKVFGGGGRGGTGGSGANGTAGSNGGDAVYCRLNMGVTIDASGEIKAAGGGGGGGAGAFVSGVEPKASGGGGGGGGYPNGSGGAGGVGDGVYGGNGSAGSAGTVSGGGAGGAGGSGSGALAAGATGAAGGAAATSGTTAGGAAGGAAGYAVRKNGNTVGVTNNGTMTGTAG